MESYLYWIESRVFIFDSVLNIHSKTPNSLDNIRTWAKKTSSTLSENTAAAGWVIRNMQKTPFGSRPIHDSPGPPTYVVLDAAT